MPTMDQQIEAYYKKVSPKEGWHSAYSLGKCHEVEMSNGVAWERSIFKNGIKVGSVENRGDGGCHHYTFNTREDQKHFEAVANDAYLGRDIEEREDTFVDWMDMAQEKAIAKAKKNAKSA